MLYFLLFISVLTDTLRNMYNNHFSKSILKTDKDAVLFNMICGMGAIIFFILAGADWRISGFSLITTVFFFRRLQREHSILQFLPCQQDLCPTVCFLHIWAW